MFRISVVALAAFLIFACASTPERKVQIVSSPLSDSFRFTPLSPKTKAYYANEIEPLYEKLLLKTGFNGSILIAKNGEIIFEDYRGFLNLKTKEVLDTNTATHLASISKTFTAMAVLHLMEQGKIGLDDNIQKYLPEFPYQGITIKELLSHRSGLGNYVHFMDGTVTQIVYRKNKRGKMVKTVRTVKSAPLPKDIVTNQDVLRYMIEKRPPLQGLPDRTFNYCNTNYAMLALIVEKITNQPFPQYMKDSLFTPLGMSHTFVFSIKDTANYIPSYHHNGIPFRLEKLDCVYGDKNVYSTVRDMFLWDKALYQGTFVSRKTLEMAFQPYSNEKHTQHNYGLGWRMLINPPEPTIIYHNGWWHGNRTVFTRLVHDTATIIVLSNKDNHSVYSAKKMASVFTGFPDTTNMVE